MRYLLVVIISIAFLLTPKVNGFASNQAIFGKCSWYSRHDKTDPWTHRFNADGSQFNENALTCAMSSRSFGKRYKVTNLRNGRTVIVKHVDYNPFRRYKGRDMSDRVIDLTKAAFAIICDLDHGLCLVKVEEIK